MWSLKKETSLSNDDLRAFLKEKLPDYMVPAAFVSLEKMPLTHNGKLDRKALPAPEYKATHAYVAPRDELEQKLCQVFQDVLHLEKIGIMDNFFELGGNSLLAMQIIAHLRRDLKLEIPLRSLFEKPTVAEFSEEVKKAQKTTLTAITVANRNNRLPLSFAQQRLWFLDKFTPNSNEYNVGGAIKLHGHLDIKALNQAFRYLIERHEILRTYFKEDENGGYQYIQQKLPFTLQERHLENSDKQEALLTTYLEEITQTTFNLSEGPLLKAGLVFLDNQESILWVAMHHIISDGWSVTIFIQELALAYNAYRQQQTPPLAPLAIQYADYSAWQRQYLAEGSQTLKTQLDFWTNTLADVPTLLNLPTDKPRPALRSAAGAQLAFLIDKNLSDGLKALADKEQVSLFMLLVAAFSVLLARHSGQNDILIGTPTANRKQAEVEHLLGCFINTLVLRTTIKPSQSFQALLQQVKQNTLDAFAHQDLPFEDLVDHLHVERSLSHTPLFQVMLILQNTEQADFNLDGLTVQSQPLPHNTAKFDLTMELQEIEEGLSGSLEYATDLFVEETMQRLLDHWLLLLQGIVAQPQTVIHRLPLLSQEEQQILVDWNHTLVDYPKEQTLQALFEAQVEKNPDATALVFDDQTLSYRELNAKANQLAHYLVEQGIKPDSLVALCLERSLEMLITIFAILKAGAAYLPLDPENPPERLHIILDTAKPGYLFCLDSLQSVLAPLFAGKLITLSQMKELLTQEKNKNNLKHKQSASTMCYTIFTSGSTGTPKGVANIHSAVVNRLLWMKDYNKVTEHDVILQKTPYTFDVSVWELFVPLLCGSKLVIAKPNGHKDPAYLADLINQQGITLLHFVPSMLASFLNEPSISLRPEIKRRIVVSGEALTQEINDRLFAKLNAELHNFYGPTEAAIDVSFYPCEPQQKNYTVPIGKPIWNAQLYILDDQLTPTGIGIPGELYIAGVGLARGYLNRPDLTAERFIANPFSTKPGARMYKTGDLCRYLPDGNIEYLGRLDHQVKIRGFRIELGEIEASLQQHPTIKEAVVLAREDIPDEKRLVAYMVFKEGASLSNEELRAFLKQNLPDYMVPAAFVSLEKMPLTSSGKLDRKALPAPEYKATHAFVAPRDELEQTLCQIFQDVLHLEKIGIMDNFFELGGNSLLATQITAHIRRDLKLEIPLRTLFEKMTVAEFSEEVKKAQKTTLTAITVANRNDRLPLSFAQQRLWFLDKFTPNSNEYNTGGAIKLHGHLDIKALNQAFRYLIERHEILRTYFKEDENGGYQYIQQKLPFTLQERHLENSDKQEALLTTYLEEVTQTTFNLSEGPLLKAGLVFLDNQESILWVAMHHIISDGWSVTIFIQELALAYNAYRQQQTPPLAPLAIQYADYSAWQRQYLAKGSQTLKTQLDFWTNTLADAPTLLNLPTDKPRPALRSAAGAQLAFLIDKNLSDGLKVLADKEQVSLFMLLVAAFSVLLARHSGQNDILIGTPTANRKQAEVEHLLGCFINTLVLRTTIKPSQSFQALLQQVKQNTLDAFAHQDLPFEDLVDHLHLERSLSHTPLFQVMLILQNTEQADFNLDGLTVQSQPLPHNTAKFDLTMELQEIEEGLSGSLEYAS